MEKLIADISEHEIRENGFHPEKLAKEFYGVMLRLGWAGYNGELVFDDEIEEHIKAAADAGLHIGLYLCCYCKNPAAANLAANRAAKFASKFGEKIDLPIALSVKETHLPCLTGQGREGLTDTVSAFLFEIKRSGFIGILDTYAAFAMTYLDMNRLRQKELWITDFRMDEKAMRRQLKRDDWGMWRYSFDKMGFSRCRKDYPKMRDLAAKEIIAAV